MSLNGTSKFDESPKEYYAHPRHLSHHPGVFFSVMNLSGYDTQQTQSCNPTVLNVSQCFLRDFLSIDL